MRDYCLTRLLLLPILVLLCVTVCATVAFAEQEVDGVAFEYSADVSRDYQSYGLSAVALEHLGTSRVTAGFQAASIHVVRLDNHTYVSSNALIELPVSLIGGFSTLALPMLLNSSRLEWNIDQDHMSKLLLGFDKTWFLVKTGSRDGFERGIVLSPLLGIQSMIGGFRVRLEGKYNFFWRFSHADRSLNFGLGLTVGFGPEFFIP